MRVGDLRQKVVFTLLMLIVFRIGSFIPVPGSNKDVLNFYDQANAFGFLNTFGGGALGNFSIFAMGIMPYITASIIIQLLQMDVVPKFTEWSKQGDVGRRKLAQFTRYFTIILGFIQALGMSYGFNTQSGGLLIENPGIGTYLLIAIVLTAGTAFLMWLGEQITSKGVGNGISIIIFAGIAAGIRRLRSVQEQHLQLLEYRPFVRQFLHGHILLHRRVRGAGLPVHGRAAAGGPHRLRRARRAGLRVADRGILNVRTPPRRRPRDLRPA
jgi:preprotein translocase subunit SecY